MRGDLLVALACLMKWGAGLGHQGRSADDKIVGGSEVPDIREMPYIISISLVVRNCTVTRKGTRKCKGPERWLHVCAGNLLNPLYVITACHCLADFKNSTPERMPAIKMAEGVEEWRYVAGSRRIKPLDETAQIRVPLEFHYHPNCAKEELLAISDLGIAKMREPYTINEYVRPVKLLSTERYKFQAAFKSVSQQKHHCQVSGWGSTLQERITDKKESLTEAHRVSYILKTARMEVLTQAACSMRLKAWASPYLDSTPMNFDERGQICIASSKGNEGFCTGDSGGPFVCNGYLVALVSNSIECGTPLPQVCQTILVLFDWIRKDFCTKSDCSDIYYQKPEVLTHKQQMSSSPVPKTSTPELSKTNRAEADGSSVARVTPRNVVTVNMIQLFIYFV